MSKKRLFSGIQPTGELHIGNYFGAVANWTVLQNTHDSIHCVVDYHAMTVDYDPAEMPQRVLSLTRELIACGLDPEKCTLFVQSDVPVHTELAWILSTVTGMGRLQNMTQFKEKSEQNMENINAGLFTYPILQAADILIYKGEIVPVGDDQLQHLELSREIARRFNARFGEDTFPVPEPKLSNAPRIKGLDGDAKMSKSKGNTIGIFESAEDVWEKLRPAYTDPARQRLSDPGDPDICNIFTLHNQVSPPELVTEVDSACRKAEIGCIECKKRLNVHLNAVLEPIRERGRELDQHPDMINDVLDAGAKRCREMAAETMTEVREKTGLVRR
jgi:tryptophanyl-tRNA synthetase